MAEPLNSLKIAAEVHQHRVTARQMADEALARAERMQDQWRAFIALTPDLARKQAEEVDRALGAGKRLPLAGVPFAVKDVIDVTGLPTTCGSKAFTEPAAGDAMVVRRMMAAGAVLIGKLNMHECAFGFTGENPHFGDCKNPWDASRIAGGSSSGSAVAVALGICPLTLGSDTGGSIRQPAALCGLTGLKPTYGRISRAGVAPLSWTMDHVGPLARSAEEAAQALAALSGRDETDESSSSRPVPNYGTEIKQPIRDVRIGLPRRWFYEALDPQVAAAIEAAAQQLTELGCRTVEVELPHMKAVLGAHRAIIFSEAGSYYWPFLQDRPERFGREILPLLQAGLFLPAVDYLHAQRVRRVIRRAWAEVFRTVDCLLTPTTPMTATRFGQQTADLPGGAKPLVRAYLDLTLPFNLSGHPALSAPCGFSRENLPIGMQIVGRPFDEALILRLAHHYQQVTDWHRRMAAASK
jgi:aspartyl-tRNA(Asn)/glutamyl-tRNA(Gln) amidotransferase subunit A